MPTFELKPWKEDTELELCGSTFCFELKDKGHRVYAFYHEYGDKGSMTLDVDLQKANGYKDVIRKMAELDLPTMPLDKNPQFYTIYKTVTELFNEKRDVNLVTKWEDQGVNLSTTVILDKRRVYVLFRAVYGPHRLYYQADTDTKEHDRWLRHFLINAAGLYQLFREYVKGESANQELQEKT
jgi:hypothetical protein